MDEDKVILNIHHGGKFVKDTELRYEGGGEISIEPFDLDKFSFFGFKGYAADIGYEGMVEFNCAEPGSTLDTGLRRIGNDDDARDMATCCRGAKEVDVYIVHGIDEPELVPEALPSTTNVGGTSGGQSTKAKKSSGPQSKPCSSKAGIDTVKATSSPKSKAQKSKVVPSISNPKDVEESLRSSPRKSKMSSSSPKTKNPKKAGANA